MIENRILLFIAEQSVADGLTRDVFNPAGYDLVSTADKENLFKLIDQICPEILLVGRGPEQEVDFELVKLLTTTHPLIPLIVFEPNKRNQSLIRLAMKAGAADCLIAPLRPKDILDSVANIQRRKKIQLDHIKANYSVETGGNSSDWNDSQTTNHKYENILYEMPDGVIVIDQESQIVFANPISRKIFGILDPEINGKPLSRYVSDETLLELLKSYQAQKKLPNQVEIKMEEHQTYLTRCTRISNLGLVLTFHDVTHFKELDRIKSEFVHTVSHDLRSPLTAILGYIELISRSGEVNAMQKEFIRRIQLSVQSITDLINALLDLGRIEAGMDWQKERVPMGAIINFAVSEVEYRVNTKKQQFKLDVPEFLPVVRGDPVRLRQLLNNLLENASKYTPEGGTVALRAMAEGEQFILQIQDTGIGIPKEDQPYIFDKMFRGSNFDDDVPGTGLGLSIVRSIVETHGGRLWFESAENVGTTFTVVLPTENWNPVQHS